MTPLISFHFLLLANMLGVSLACWTLEFCGLCSWLCLLNEGEGKLRLGCELPQTKGILKNFAEY